VHGVVHEEVLGNSLFYFNSFTSFLHPCFFHCLLAINPRKNNLGASLPKVIDPPTSQNWKKNPCSPSMDEQFKKKSKKVILEVLSSQK